MSPDRARAAAEAFVAECARDRRGQGRRGVHRLRHLRHHARRPTASRCCGRDPGPDRAAPVRARPARTEARLTFLAVRRWFGWSSGRLLVLDIGGGSLEMASGYDEEPEVACSLPFGAGAADQGLAARRPAGRRGGPRAAQARARRDRQGVGDLVRYGGRTAWSRPRRRSGSWPGCAARRRAARASTSRAACTARTCWTGCRTAGRMRTPSGPSCPGSPQGRRRAAAGRRDRRRRGDGPVRAPSQLDICPWALREGVILRRAGHAHAGPGHLT